MASELREGQETVRTEMARTSAEIDALIAARLDDEHRPDRESYEGIAKAPSRADVVTALHRALDQRLIASFGVRVEIGGSTGLYLWFRPESAAGIADDPLRITVQTWDLNNLFDLPWQADVGVVDYFLALGAKIKEAGHWTGDGGFAPAESLQSLSDLLLAGQKAMIAGVPEAHAEVFEKVEDWIVCEHFLTNPTLNQPYQIPYRELKSTNWQRHMQEKTWVRMRTFQVALDVAICLIADGIADGTLPDYLPGVWQHRPSQRDRQGNEG